MRDGWQLFACLLGVMLFAASACTGAPPAAPSPVAQRTTPFVSPIATGVPPVAAGATPGTTPTALSPTPTTTITPPATRRPASATPVVTQAVQSDLSQALAALSILPSYEADTRMEVKTGNQMQVSRILYKLAAPDRYELIFEFNEAGQSRQTSHLIRFNDKYYLKTGEQGEVWFELSASGEADIPSGLGTLKPENYWLLIVQNIEKTNFKPEPAGNENINGVMARHMHSTITQPLNLLQSDLLSTTTLDYWIAEQGGYPARILINGTGTDQRNAALSLTLTLNISNAGKPVEITLPPANKIQKMP